jgi:gamma-glutamyltranspeptidase/glutathione hydrolase
MDWPALLQPAIQAADKGYVLDERIARYVGLAFDEFSDYSKAIFGRNGEPLGAGDRLVQKDLANTLRILAADGPAAIYGGALGQAIDEAMQATGGFLAMTTAVMTSIRRRHPPVHFRCLKSWG